MQTEPVCATCGIVINENYDPNVCEDVLDALKKIAPQGIWRHDRVDGNADAHIKASIVGPSQVIPLKEDVLQLGTWQAITLADFDGPKRRHVIIEVL